MTDRLKLATRVYALYCREDQPSVGAIAHEVFGEDTITTRRSVNSLIDEKRRECAREGAR